MCRYLSSCLRSGQMKFVTYCLVVASSALLSCNLFAERILVLGDSLSAAYNMPIESGWVNLLTEELAPEYDVINASVSGETTGGGLARLPKLLEEVQPNWVIIELGGNDGLRGFPLPLVKNNLAQMGALSKEANAKPIYLGIRIPPNYGARYTNAFEEIFPSVSSEMEAPYLNLFMEKFYTDENLLQNDGIHPSKTAQPLIKEHVAGFLKPLLSE